MKLRILHLRYGEGFDISVNKILKNKIEMQNGQFLLIATEELTIPKVIRLEQGSNVYY